MIERDAPQSVADLNLEPRGRVFPSPQEWRDQILYFLLPDRFSDAREPERPAFERANPRHYAIADKRVWMEGGIRFQGGTLRGIRSKLDYLRGLGVTSLWIGPIWKQRSDLQTYHGYAIQNFLEVEPRLGTRADLRDLVDEAHDCGMYVLLDVIFNHTGNNWFYDDGGAPRETMPYRESGHYPFHSWRSSAGQSVRDIKSMEDGVWPREFQNPEWYHRAGSIRNWDDPSRRLSPEAEFRRGDFSSLKDLALEKPEVMEALIKVYQHWIAVSDCDGFRVDTVKHVSPEASKSFCEGIRKFATSIGKHNFLLLGEVTGSYDMARDYVQPVGDNLDAALDITDAPQRLAGMVKGLVDPKEFFDHFGGRDAIGHYRLYGNHHVSVLDDHDMVWRERKHRFAWNNPIAAADVQLAHAVGVQLTTPGIPCIYYGTEQAFDGSDTNHDAGIEPGSCDCPIPHADRYIRESMFGGTFGAFMTLGCHFFDASHPAYGRIALLARLRSGRNAVGLTLRRGELYLRDTRVNGDDFALPAKGGLVGWSRIFSRHEVVIVLNTHGLEPRYGDITIDNTLHPIGSTLGILYRGDANGAEQYKLSDAPQVEVKQSQDGRAFVHIELAPAGMAVLGQRR
jgi:glycosidase